ncbi:hypothetical protein [Iamia sp.]|uniref:hypothetical protein n=1 Tax=Iamia sp. TaxID=2722710 RepID=UPI002C20BA5A|nr:hypothetical protein [Iamia sp.]HXH59414.1 hypothetical protein [Iamia sp.]
MNRAQLAHVLRAASKIASDGDIIVIGSQSILGAFGEMELPEEATLSAEADVAFRNDVEAHKAATQTVRVGASCW